MHRLATINTLQTDIPTDRRTQHCS